jgi:hypothetical protein
LYSWLLLPVRRAHSPKLTIWRVDEALRPVLVGSVDERGSAIGPCVWGGGGEGGRGLEVYYSVPAGEAGPVSGCSATSGPGAVIKWADDRGRVGVVQV